MSSRTAEKPAGIDRYDHKESYCRKLGHILQFKYCRSAQQGIPCAKIMDCWIGKLPVRQFIMSHYQGQMEEIFRPPSAKISSILEIVDRVKKQSAS